MNNKPQELILSSKTSMFAKLRQDSILIDITFIVTNGVKFEKIFAHKILLAASSSYFKSLFNYTKENEIQINGIDPDIFKLVINSIYGENILENDWHTLLNILILIKFLLIDEIDIDSYVKLIEPTSDNILAYIHGLNLLYPDGFDIEYLDLIADKIKYDIDLSSLNDDVIKYIFSSDKYQPLDELITLNMINRLVEQNNRNFDFYGFVRFASIPKNIRDKLVENEIISQSIIDKYMDGQRRELPDINNLTSFNKFFREQLLKYGNDFELGNKNGYDPFTARIMLPVRQKEYKTVKGKITFGPETIIKGCKPKEERRAVFDTDYFNIKYNDFILITKYELIQDFDVGCGRIYIKIKEWTHFL